MATPPPIPPRDEGLSHNQPTLVFPPPRSNWSPQRGRVGAGGSSPRRRREMFGFGESAPDNDSSSFISPPSPPGRPSRPSRSPQLQVGGTDRGEGPGKIRIPGAVLNLPATALCGPMIPEGPDKGGRRRSNSNFGPRTCKSPDPPFNRRPTSPVPRASPRGDSNLLQGTTAPVVPPRGDSNLLQVTTAPVAFGSQRKRSGSDACHASTPNLRASQKLQQQQDMEAQTTFIPTQVQQCDKPKAPPRPKRPTPKNTPQGKRREIEGFHL